MNRANTCPTAWLFVKPLTEMQHSGLNLKLGKRKVPGGRKHI